MSSLLSHSHYFLHVHLHDSNDCYWVMVDPTYGPRLNTYVYHAEAVAQKDVVLTCDTIIADYGPAIRDVVAIPCCNERLTDAQKRLIRVV